MQTQRGVALVIVMVLLSSTAMLGLSAMHASLLETRQASSFRAMALTQMAAEDVAVELIEQRGEVIFEDCLSDSDGRTFTAGASHSQITHECRPCTNDQSAILLRSRFTDQARNRVIVSRALVITRQEAKTSDLLTFHWHWP